MIDLAGHLQEKPNMGEGKAELIESDAEVLRPRVDIIRLASQAFRPGLPMCVLDIGPAMGWETARLSGIFNPGVVDVVTLFQEEAAELAKRIPNSITVADMHALPAGWSGRYGLVFASHVLEHSPAPLIALREWFRVLVSGGAVFIVMPEPAGAVGAGTTDRYCRLDCFQEHVFSSGVETMINLLRRAGFVLDSYREVPQYTLGHLAYWHRIWIGRKP